MSGPHLISLRDLGDDDISWLVDRTLHHAAARRHEPTLAGRVVGLYFAMTSTRTRTAFTTGAMRLGAHAIGYGPGDLQLNTGETLSDTARVFGAMLDALVVRTPSGFEDLRTLAGPGAAAVVNAMNADEHPTQALADLATMKQVRGSLDGLRVLYLGEANSTATALAIAMSRCTGSVLHVRTPPGYGLPDWTLSAVEGGRGRVVERHDVADLPDEVDFVYTARWQTTGTSKPDPDWRDRFAPFQVDGKLLGRYRLAWFLHDLPAHRGEEVTAEVIDGDRSIVFQQAANKLYSAMAALEWCLGRP